MHAGL